MAHASSPSAVLFDLDGTLIATRRLYLESFADALEPVLGHRPTHDEMIALRPRAERRFLLEMGGAEAHRGVMARFYRSYEARHERDFEGIYRGVPALLRALRTLEVPLGLVTGKSLQAYRITEPHIGLGPWAVEVFDDDVPEPKPDPTGLRLALERLGCEPERAVYLGDTVTDLEAARRAGMRPMGVLWSKRAHERDAFRAAALERGGGVLPTPESAVEQLGVRVSTK